MGESAGDHGRDSVQASIESENIRDAGADMPGMRGALKPGGLDHASVDPDQVQGDEHRDPPANAPTPPQPGDSPRVRSIPDPIEIKSVKPA